MKDNLEGSVLVFDVGTSENLNDIADATKKGVLTDSTARAYMEIQNDLGHTENRNIDLAKRHRSSTILEDGDIENESNNRTGISCKLTTENYVKEFDRKKAVKGMTIVDTESESEEEIAPFDNSFKHDIEDMKSKIHSILDNDNETDLGDNQNVNNIKETDSILENDKSLETINNCVKLNDILPNKIVHSYINSETTNEVATHGTKFARDETNLQKSRLAMLCDSDSDDESSSFNPNSPKLVPDDEVLEQSQSESGKKTQTKKTRLAMLCDSDSDDESSSFNPNSPKLVPDDEILEQSQPESEKKTQTKMTSKEAAELRKEIQSESQRMMRERNISLPYHTPKAHSLKEFLARRPRLAIAVPAGPAQPYVALKMTTQQLRIISKNLKERKKEVQEFYKSEGESENDSAADDNVININSKIANTTREGKMEDSDIELAELVEEADTAKVSDDDISDDFVESTKTDHKEVLQEEYETECVEPNSDDLLDAEKIANDINSSRDINTGIEQEVITTKTVTEKETIETNSISQTEKNRRDSEDRKKIVKLNESSHDNSSQIRTENYDFHLNDENTEKVISSDIIVNNREPFNFNEYSERCEQKIGLETSSQEPMSRLFPYSDIDGGKENLANSEILQNVLEENNFDKPVSPPIKSKFEILREKLANIKPNLSGGPDKTIDLNSALVKPKEVVELMQRFTKHVTSKKQNSKHKVQMSVVIVESGGDIHKETVALNVNNEEAEVREEKPGAKLQRLREELQKQIDREKSEIWQQRAAKGIRENGESCEEDGEFSENGEDDGLDDDEEEAEITEDEDSEGELESDIELSEKELKRSAFLDQEAEESDEEYTSHKEECEVEISSEEMDIAESVNEESESIQEHIEDLIAVNKEIPSDSSKTELECRVGKKRIFKNILTFDDDSDEDNLFADPTNQKTTTNEELDSTITADEDDIPPHQTRQVQTPMHQSVSQAKSISDFLTPISFITSIQNLASASKGNKNGTMISPFKMAQTSTIEEISTVSQKNLFDDLQGTEFQESLDVPVTQTQELSSSLGQDCEIGSLQTTQLENNDEPPCTQDLIDICSGNFTGVTQLDPSHESEMRTEFDSQNSELKNLDTDQEMVISQLLDEEELENFKKKFESPINAVTTNVKAQEITGGGIIDSDEEDEDNYLLRKTKNQRRIQFLDDESFDEGEDDSEKEIDLQDNDEDEIDNIGYDSEENEIDLNEIEKKPKMKMADFLDAEAELSESDWSSEDEDEKDMDKLEFELGDTETFDVEQIKENLEKIHMRRMLDDDTREIKLLQEVLLEDGEMHGTGRQRQFKWKKIELDNDQSEEQKGDEIYLDEEQSEEHWRKKRHEREMYLKENQYKSPSLELEDNDLLNYSQMLKIGQKVLQRSQNNSLTNTLAGKTNDVAESTTSKIPRNLSSKRGSFLSKSDQALQRVAGYTRNTVDDSLNSTKTTKNVLFLRTSASEVTSTEDSKKRKASDGTPNVLKRLRLNTSLSPAVKKKTERSRKLFNF